VTSTKSATEEMMAKKFLYLYSGGNPPKSPEEGKAMMDAWMGYFGKLGPAIGCEPKLCD